MFWKKFLDCCNKAEKSPNAVAKELGISSGAVTAWKNSDRVPQERILLKIAEYFGVSVEYLLGKEKSPAGAGLKEKHGRLITAYERAEGPIKEAVDRLLKIEDKPVLVKIAARDGSFQEREITQEEWEKIQGLPDANL